MDGTSARGARVHHAETHDGQHDDRSAGDEHLQKTASHEHARPA